jgi:hypothetical protein
VPDDEADDSDFVLEDADQEALEFARIFGLLAEGPGPRRRSARHG